MKTKVLAILLTLGFALWGAAAWADEFTQTTEPFARSAEAYTEGYLAFAPPANLPTRGDFETVKLDDPSFVPWRMYSLRESERSRFQFELQTMDPLELGPPSGGN